MKINKSQFHTRYFLAMDRLWYWWTRTNPGSYPDKVFDGDLYTSDPDDNYTNRRRYETPTETNICLYIRTTVLYPLIMSLFFVGTLFIVGGAVFWYPIHIFGVFGWTGMYLSMAGMVAFCFVVGWFNKTSVGRKFKGKREEYADNTADWWTMVSQWFEDRHDKVCTLVEITEDNGDDDAA